MQKVVSFGSLEDKVKKFCAAHKGEHDVNLNTTKFCRVCNSLDPPVETVAFWGLAGATNEAGKTARMVPARCDQHKLPDVVKAQQRGPTTIRGIYCQTCKAQDQPMDRIASFGPPPGVPDVKTTRDPQNNAPYNSVVARSPILAD